MEKDSLVEFKMVEIQAQKVELNPKEDKTSKRKDHSRMLKKPS